MTVAAEHAGSIWPLLVYFAALVALVCAMFAAGYLLGVQRDHSGVEYPFESGVLPVGQARFRISVHFYMVAMFFVLFDLETVFILAWAVSFRDTGWTGYAMAVVFIAELGVGLAYIWRLGALDWAPREGRAALAIYKHGR